MNLRFTFCRTVCLAVVAFFVALFFATSTSLAQDSSGSHRDVVWLDFRYQSWSDIKWPVGKKPVVPYTGIDLTQNVNLGSAFLRELKRQSVLIAARDELGAITRDAFLDETAPEGAVKIESLETIFKQVEDFDTTSENLDYPKLLAQWESYSRNEFVDALKSEGVKATPLPKSDNDTAKEKLEDAQIDELLLQHALIPNFEAIRRIHETIRSEGETLSRLKNLVHAYTHMQILTNAMPRDTHRVFQARAVLYAQRAVAKYGNENPELLTLRAATWSYCNFHRIARREFAVIVNHDTAEITDEKLLELIPDPWYRLAYRYANFDLNGFEWEFAALAENTQRPFARLLFVILVSYSKEKYHNSMESRDMLTRYVNEIFSELPVCERLFHGGIPAWMHNWLSGNEMSPYGEQFMWNFPGQVQNMRHCPKDVTISARKAQQTLPWEEFVGGGMSEEIFNSWREILPCFGNLIQTMRNTTLEDDSGDLSFQALAAILEDEHFTILFAQTRRIFRPNDDVDLFIQMSGEAIGAHPLYPFLSFFYKNEENKNKFRETFTATRPDTKIKSNMFSQMTPHFYWRHVFRRSNYDALDMAKVADCYADRENVRDILIYHVEAGEYGIPSTPQFTTEVLYELCPNNPYAMVEQMVRNNGDEILADRMASTYPQIDAVLNAAFWFYNRNDRREKMLTLFKKHPKHNFAHTLAEMSIRQNDYKNAIQILKTALSKAHGDGSTAYGKSAKQLGLILMDQGKMEEAKPYLEQADRALGVFPGFPHLVPICHEMVGEFDKAEELARQRFEEGKSNPFPWFATCYRTKNPHLVYALDRILEQYSGEQEMHRMQNVVEYGTMLYTLRLMDAPMHDYVEYVGKKPDLTCFFETQDSISGFHACFDAIEKGDKKNADRWLNILAYGIGHQLAQEGFEWLESQIDKPVVTDGNVLVEQQTVYDNFPVRDMCHHLAKIFILDQKTEKPGKLKQDEIDFLVRRYYLPGNSSDIPLWVLYLTGRYYELCGEQEKAMQSYRRLLALRASTGDFPRSFAVHCLRKAGLKKEEYLQAVMADPKVATQVDAMTWPDQICRQLFRNYSPSPLESMLAKPVPQEMKKNVAKVIETDSNTPKKINQMEHRITKIWYRGEEIPENEINVLWEFNETEDWHCSGIAFSDTIPTNLGPQDEKEGFYPVVFGKDQDSLRARAYFYANDEMVLVISLRKDKEPDSPYPAPDSDCVRIEMKQP